MDPNLLYWKDHGQSFFSRLRIWVNLLDPVFLLASDGEIQKAHDLLREGTSLKKVDENALNLSLLSKRTSPKVRLRLYNPLHMLILENPCHWFSDLQVVASLLPFRTVPMALSWQFLLQSYSVGFNHANRNLSSEQCRTVSLKQLLILTGTVSCATCAGALPQIFINRLGIRSASILTFFRSIFPIPLSAALAVFNVFSVRGEEAETGIMVFDSSGSPVGLSEAAGQKAVKETALSRAALMGTATAVPNLLVLLLKRTRSFQRNPSKSVLLPYFSAVFVLGLMIPTSFSLFPQLGTIREEDIEEKLKTRALNGQLYYHRGL